jgi:PadR family transcriptional regulator, regulatory protein AphA
MLQDMSLEHAVLGFLSYGPLSGYDLKKAFDLSVRHFWPADQSQIYRTLGRMEQEGWVEVEVIQQEDRPPRKVYSVTPAGEEELTRWLLAPQPLEQARSAWLIQVFFAGRLSDEQIIGILERLAGRMRERLERYGQIGGCTMPYQQKAASPRQPFFWLLTLDYGMAMARASLEWVESTIARLKNGEQDSFTMSSTSSQ